jgi:O-antigen/teichoic acid export membrane protein
MKSTLFGITIISSQTRRSKYSLTELSIAERLARGSFWLLVGIVSARLLSLVSTILVARILGKEGLGELGIYQSTIDMLGVLAGFGLGTSLTRYIAQFRHKDPEKAGRIFTLISVIGVISSTVIAVVFFIVSPWLASSVLNRPAISDLFRVGGVLLIISTVLGVEMGSLAGFEAFDKTARISFWQGLAITSLTISGVWFFGVLGAVLAGIVSGIVGIILGTYYLTTECRENDIVWKFETNIWSEQHVLWKFAFPAMISSMLLWPVIWVTNRILVNQPGGYGELGRFNAANQWGMLFLLLQGILAPAMLPILAEIHGNGDRSQFRSAMSLNTKAAWIIALPIATLLISFCHPLAKIYGEEFKGIEIIITILAISGFLNLINSTIGVALVSSERIWLGTFMNFGWALVVIIASSVLIPKYGAIGMALAYLLAYLAHSLWQMAYVEMFLAPRSLSSQWPLFVISIITLPIVFSLSMFAKNSYVLEIAIVLISFYPLFKASTNQIKRIIH